MKLKIKAIPLILFFVIFSALFILASIYDFQISKLIVDLDSGKYFSNNWFGVFFEVIGSFPVYYVFGFSAFVFAFNSYKLKKNLGTVFYVFFMVVGIFALYLGADDCMKDFADHVKSYGELHFIVRALIALALGVLVAVPTIFFLGKLSQKTISDLFVFAVVAFVACAFAQLSVHLVKPLVGRARYRAIWLLGDESLYTPWYIFNGERISNNFLLINIGATKDAFRSFPSGHTASAGAIYVLLALPYCLKQFDNKKSKIILTCISVGVTGMVAVSRIIVGAHYFSDVLIGGTFSFVWVFITLFIVKLIIGKIEKKTNKPFVDEIGNINLPIFDVLSNEKAEVVEKEKADEQKEND